MADVGAVGAVGGVVATGDSVAWSPFRGAGSGSVGGSASGSIRSASELRNDSGRKPPPPFEPLPDSISRPTRSSTGSR
jgi:hypothetical protein